MFEIRLYSQLMTIRNNIYKMYLAYPALYPHTRCKLNIAQVIQDHVTVCAHTQSLQLFSEDVHVGKRAREGAFRAHSLPHVEEMRIGDVLSEKEVEFLDVFRKSRLISTFVRFIDTYFPFQIHALLFNQTNSLIENDKITCTNKKSANYNFEEIE